MKKPLRFHISSHLLIRNLARIYWRIGGLLVLLLVMVISAGILMAYLDGKGIADGLYLAFITALTIGYGDVTPESPLSKVLAIVTGGIGILFTGIVVAVTLKALEMTINEQENEDNQ